jgi:hypothetical protein
VCNWGGNLSVKVRVGCSRPELYCYDRCRTYQRGQEIGKACTRCREHQADLFRSGRQ